MPLIGLALVLLINSHDRAALSFGPWVVTGNGQGCGIVDRDSVGNDKIGARFVLVRFKGAGVSRVGLQGEAAFAE